ncbi:hypothetical protein WOLCODRAFT_28281 [Wolfiporia cocos MD-104 SS10]|uniref:Gti1/Pac2 family-domain-containing protein n=1 Tax=Wolfiporia cocos (strain MD-104) TaxID=742152 RepID=A0A2H3J1F8_WOLCO|nr:hypothetical protein WOLCODRAFT_28281 [Wolfiporia cocos MD-104 SS10]
MPPQVPTCLDTRVETVADAHVIFYSVFLNMRPKVVQRLNVHEREHIHSGSVFVWEERPSEQDASGVGISRWTDGRRWGPSRVRDEFLFYLEKLPEFQADPVMTAYILSSRLIKQTYSALVNTPAGERKWHLVAYYTIQSHSALRPIDDDVTLGMLRNSVPPGLFHPARMIRAVRGRSPSTDDREPIAGPSRAAHQCDSPSPSPSPSPRALLAPLPELKPHPLQELCGLQPDPHQAQACSLRSDKHDLAPLIYLRTTPYPPRHPIDCVALRSLDCMVRIV